MTPQEFKAWFEGYAEGIDKTPSDKQWKRIKARVAEIDGRATDRTVFVDRYWRERRWNTPDLRPYWIAMGIGADALPQSMKCSANGAGSPEDRARRIANNQTVTADFGSYDPAAAFNSLGRADALADA